MIEVFEGRLGGGKTYSAVVRIVGQLAVGGIVCTNIELVPEKIAALLVARFGVVMQADQIIKLLDEEVYQFHKYTPSGTVDLPVLVVLDEAHIHFNARDFAKTDKNCRETLIFLTQSRKVNTDIIFISQSALNLDKQFARLVQYIWRFRDLAKWRIPGLGITCPFKGILSVQFDYDGRTVLQRQFIPKDRAIFGCYNTNSLLRGFPRLQGVNTRRQLQRVQKSGRWLLVALVVVLLVNAVLLAGLLASFQKI
jgi:hypothetical protein